MTRYFVNGQGKYLGGFDCDPAFYPAGGVPVPSAPAHALDTWNGAGWTPHVPAPDPANAVAAVARANDKALADLGRAIDAGDTPGALRLVQTLFQEKQQ